ncbi:DUF445 family protein [Nocardia sp. NBC_00565]|uniref:DUF445 domain-containing protein n=1 Tax=Nocardia sp. NBC_00565 TaxID=2975993 RepID=UPI002E818C19|nr:DUF445 family protein [Nocardia sp. NBC_00565]WUC06664.1 DUF445 family protein [Nocardia sp. NBC_00565]
MPIVQDIADNWTVYAMMPLVAALIGYVTKLVAVEMMFRPIEFLGIPPYLGWQGVIPRNAARMGAASVDLMLGKLLDPQEIIERIDLDDLMKRLADPMHTMVAEVTRELMNALQPTLWQALPEVVQNRVIGRVEAAVPGMLDTYIADLRANVDVVLDIRMLAIKALIRDKTLLVKMIRTIGSNEMRFIVRVGIPFGFVLGIVQAGAWAATHSPLIMPSFGAVTGFTTDWLALQMIFRPVRPTRYLGIFTWQGLFIKRRDEVTRDYTRLIAEELLTPANVLEELITGPNSDRFLSMLDHEIQDAIDAQAGPAKTLMQIALGTRYSELKRIAADTAVRRMLERTDEFADYATAAMNLPEFLADKMKLMTDAEFEGLLRPAFKQDEWKLITAGAVLGLVIGEVQLHLLLT